MKAKCYNRSGVACGGVAVFENEAGVVVAHGIERHAVVDVVVDAVVVRSASSPSSGVRRLESVAGHGCWWSVWEQRPCEGLFASVPGSLELATHRFDSTARFSSRNRRKDHRALGLCRPWSWVSKAVSTGLGNGCVLARNIQAW